jgi:hypothetical protein
MIKTLPTLVLSLAAFSSGASQQPAPVHRWAPVVTKPDVRIELDTATATRTDHQRRVWLRWTFATPPDLADVQLERREVDCRRRQTRILSTEAVGGRQPPRLAPDSTEAVGGQRPPRIAMDSTAAWIRPGPGSLDEQALIAVCRWAEAGA